MSRHQQNSRDRETSWQRLKRTPCIYCSTISNSSMYSDFSNQSVCTSQTLELESKKHFAVYRGPGYINKLKLKRNSDHTSSAVHNNNNMYTDFPHYMSHIIIISIFPSPSYNIIRHHHCMRHSNALSVYIHSY